GALLRLADGLAGGTLGGRNDGARGAGGVVGLAVAFSGERGDGVVAVLGGVGEDVLGQTPRGGDPVACRGAEAHGGLAAPDDLERPALRAGVDGLAGRLERGEQRRGGGLLGVGLVFGGRFGDAGGVGGAEGADQRFLE